MIPSNPEAFLLRTLSIDRALISPDTIREIEKFIEYGECGLAYDVFIFDIQDRRYIPSDEALNQIKLAATAMNIAFPKLSTD
jgi:hypothetical protein